jgi:hypothetical protein
MTNRKILSEPFGEVDKPRETVADSFSDDLAAEPLTARLGDFWSDLIRVADERDAESPRRPHSAVPLLDEMKGILEWD